MPIDSVNFDQKAILKAYERFFFECGYSISESKKLAKSLVNGSYADLLNEIMLHFSKPITVSVKNTDTINSIIRYISVL